MGLRKEMILASSLFLAWIVGFSLLFYFLGFKNVEASLSSLNYWYYLMAFVFVLLSVLMSVFNLRAVLFIMGYPVKLYKLFKIMMSGFFIDSILPNITPAGEFSIAYFLHKEGMPVTASFNSILIHTAGWFIGFVAFGALSLFGLVLFNNIPLFVVVIMLLLLLCFVGLFLIILYLVLKPRIAEKLIIALIKSAFVLLKFTRLKSLEQRALKYAEDNIHSFTYAFRKQIKKKRLIAFSSFVLMIHHFFVAFSFYLVLVSLGINISVLEAIGMFLIIYMISLLSMVPGQFAIYESVAIPILYTRASLISSAVVVGLVRLIHYWFIVFLGGFFALKIGFEYKRSRRK